MNNIDKIVNNLITFLDIQTIENMKLGYGKQETINNLCTTMKYNRTLPFVILIKEEFQKINIKDPYEISEILINKAYKHFSN